ncbi:hypothetical protein [Rhodococcus sp. O3]|uniref:hypothetical protein n=1 Tax=Rhodococcus sp. O3 TaxID=3404919 RepID=UPI003B671678
MDEHLTELYIGGFLDTLGNALGRTHPHRDRRHASDDRDHPPASPVPAETIARGDVADRRPVHRGGRCLSDPVPVFEDLDGRVRHAPAFYHLHIGIPTSSSTEPMR